MGAWAEAAAAAVGAAAADGAVEAGGVATTVVLEARVEGATRGDAVEDITDRRCAADTLMSRLATSSMV